MSKILVIFLIALLPGTASAQSVAEEFLEIGRENIALLKQLDLPDFVSINELESAVNTTEIQVEAKLILRGAEVDAINYFEKRLIRVSETRWHALKKHVARKQYLVLHEYLGILKVELDHFASSAKIRREFQLRETDNQAVLSGAKSALTNIERIMEDLLNLDMNLLRNSLSLARTSQDFARCVDDSFLWFNERKEQDNSCNRLNLLLESMSGIVKAVNAPSRLNLGNTRWLWLSQAYPNASRLRKYEGAITNFSFACSRLAAELERSFPSYLVALHKGFPERFTALDELLKNAAPKWPEARAKYNALLDAFRAANPELE